MIKAYKYKIKPTRVQQEKLSQFFGCARFVYNWGLNKWVCPHCGTKHDRDMNAAKNIKDMGLHPQARVGIELKL